MHTLTPMMQQYMDVKAAYKDCVLFFRLGDFYEMFFEDAILVSKELELTLTGKDCGLAERAPMCGVPHHAVDVYLPRLVAKGYKVAVCEQTEDPALAKGLVARDVVRVVTPGTVLESSLLEEKANAYLMCIYCTEQTAGQTTEQIAGQTTRQTSGQTIGQTAGIAVTDLTTGTLFATSVLWGNVQTKIIDEIAKFMPREIIAPRQLLTEPGFQNVLRSRFDLYTTVLEPDFFNRTEAITLIESHFTDEESLRDGTADEMVLHAVGGILKYLEATQKKGFEHISRVHVYRIEQYLIMDSASRRNLEITETIKSRSRKGSLIDTIDRTRTSPGGRLLKRWFEQPLLDIAAIEKRHRAVGELKNGFYLRNEIRDLLRSVYDIERLTSKIILGSANCRDFLSLKLSLQKIPALKKLLENVVEPQLREIDMRLDPIEDMTALIERAISEDAPITLKEGGIIKDGYNGEVDTYRTASREGKNWLTNLEREEKQRTEIKNLKIGFNRVFGYYLEVTRSYAHLVPQHYIRKQTLANCERYITEELKKLEDEILGAEEKLIHLEYKLFLEVRERVAAEVERIKTSAAALAELDVLAALAETAEKEHYCMPTLNDDGVIEIREGRHPVVEQYVGRENFVPNDAVMDLGDGRTSVITGPNMAGKSTYMRQIALIALMAQAGSFVPAKEANIGICDRIFTRVGAADDLAAGQSTFMAEMSEVAHILSNATSRSLVILDEIGRGTSTFDGLSIAWAVIEFINDLDKIGARVLFSTHYHELTELSGKINGINNYCVAIERNGEDIKFLHKIKKGGADGSYGIHVAKLAGLPDMVTTRAKEILAELEEADISKRAVRGRRSVKPVEGQIDFLSMIDAPKQEREVLDRLKSTDLSKLTPIDTMNMLYQLQQKLRLG